MRVQGFSAPVLHRAVAMAQWLKWKPDRCA
jgi:hypothetical protein